MHIGGMAFLLLGIEIYKVYLYIGTHAKKVMRENSKLKENSNETWKKERNQD